MSWGMGFTADFQKFLQKNKCNCCVRSGIGFECKSQSALILPPPPQHLMVTRAGRNLIIIQNIGGANELAVVSFFMSKGLI